MEGTLISFDNPAFYLQPVLSAAPDIHRSAEEYSSNPRQGQRCVGKCLFLDILSPPLSWTFYSKFPEGGYESLELKYVGKETYLGLPPRSSLARLMGIRGDIASVDVNFQRRKQMKSVSAAGQVDLGMFNMHSPLQVCLLTSLQPQTLLGNHWASLLLILRLSVEFCCSCSLIIGCILFTIHSLVQDLPW